jgi:SAM-dependent methyltransferase
MAFPVGGPIGVHRSRLQKLLDLDPMSGDSIRFIIETHDESTARFASVCRFLFERERGVARSASCQAERGSNVMPTRFWPGSIDYNASISANYRAGRALSRESADAWRHAVEPFMPKTASLTILDLGAGTGRFSPLLAGFPGARVIAVEPSRSMLAVAVRQNPAATIAYLAGSGEAIPLRERSCDVAWMSHVFHHVRDRAECASELRRVLRSAGRVLLRGTFGDRLDGFPTLFEFFPGARQICKELPTVAETVAVFEVEEFTLEAHRKVEQRTCGSLRKFFERTRRRADTSLALLADEEFEAGLASLAEAAAQESEPTPVFETVDLLVFRTHARRTI